MRSAIRFSCVQRFLIILFFAAVLAGCGADDPVPATGIITSDDILQLQHLQTKGTHNSFHVAPDPAASEDNYTHATLDKQVNEQGVRHFELAVHYEYEGVWDFRIDPQTHCISIRECLVHIKHFSDVNRNHQPIVVQINILDTFPTVDLIEDYFLHLHIEFWNLFPKKRIVTPDEVQGTYPTLRDAITTRGWLPMEALRGRILFTLGNVGDIFAYYYTRDYTSLQNRMFFARARTLDDPIAAVIQAKDPVADAALIADAVSKNMLVRTFADVDMVEPLAGDTSRLQAALSSGAQFISTDVPAPLPGVSYTVDIPDGTPSRCNPVTAPPECTPEAIEDPAQIVIP